MFLFNVQKPWIYSVHFFDLDFRIFKLPESFWNRFRTILLDQELNLKKKSSKNIYFSWRNLILKNILWFFLVIFSKIMKKSLFFFKKTCFFLNFIDFFEYFRENVDVFYVFSWFSKKYHKKFTKYFSKSNFSTIKNIFRPDFFLTSRASCQLSNASG